MIIAFLLALTLSWVNPMKNEDCSPTDDIRWFEVSWAEVRIVGMTTDPDGNPVPVYAGQIPTKVRIDAWNTTYSIPMQWNNPLLPGELRWWQVRSVDGAGNLDAGNECP